MTPRGRGFSFVSRFVIVPAVYGLGFCAYEGHPLGRCSLHPPSNVPISGHVDGSGTIKHREFVMASGEMTASEFTSFLEKAFKNLVAHSADGSIHFICMDWRHLAEMTVAAQSTLGELKNLCVWVKDNGGMGTFYRSRHELVFAFKKGAAPHINNFELGQHGRYRTNVWQYKGVNTLRAGRLDELSLHPTGRNDCRRDQGCLETQWSSPRSIWGQWIDA